MVSSYSPSNYYNYTQIWGEGQAVSRGKGIIPQAAGLLPESSSATKV